MFFSILAILLLNLMSIVGYQFQIPQLSKAVIGELSLKAEKAAIEVESWFLQRQRIVDSAALKFNTEETLEAVRAQGIPLNPYLTLDKEKTGKENLSIASPLIDP